MKGLLIQAEFPPNFFHFQNSILSPSAPGQARQALRQLREMAQLVGIARAVVIGIILQKGKIALLSRSISFKPLTGLEPVYSLPVS